MSVRKCADHARAPANLADDPLEWIVGLYLAPIYCAVIDSGLRLTSCAETAPKKCHQTMEDRYVRQTTHSKCQRKREPRNSRSDSQAKPAEDECRLVAESVGPLGAPPAFAPVQSDGRGLRLRRTV